jgi:transposase
MNETSRAQLVKWIRSSTTPQRVARRSRIVLLSLEGASVDVIATQVGVSRPTVLLWRRRFEEGGPAALLHDAPGRGRRPSVDVAVVRQQLAAADLLDADGRVVNLRRAAACLHVSRASLWRALHKVPFPTR